MYVNSLLEIYSELKDEANKELNNINLNFLKEGKIMEEIDLDKLLQKIYKEKCDALPEETKAAIRASYRAFSERDRKG